MSENTLLAEAISSLSPCDGVPEGHEGNQLFLEPLGFGKPDRMYAVPLTARGRGVAVLYADYGREGAQLNVEALESLVRVAGLTVELLAANQSAVHVGSAPAVEPAKAEETVPAELLLKSRSRSTRLNRKYIRARSSRKSKRKLR